MPATASTMGATRRIARQREKGWTRAMAASMPRTRSQGKTALWSERKQVPSGAVAADHGRHLEAVLHENGCPVYAQLDVGRGPRDVDEQGGDPLDISDGDAIDTGAERGASANRTQNHVSTVGERDGRDRGDAPTGDIDRESAPRRYSDTSVGRRLGRRRWRCQRSGRCRLLDPTQ